MRLIYLHGPDRTHSLEETYATCAALVQEGLCDEIGLSNYRCARSGCLVVRGSHRREPRELCICARYSARFHSWFGRRL